METSAAAETVKGLEAFTDPRVAVIVDVPTDLEAARPEELTTATPGCELAQFTPPVRSCVLLSEYVPVAASCMVLPRATDEPDGLTVRDTRAAFETVRTN